MRFSEEEYQKILTNRSRKPGKISKNRQNFPGNGQNFPKKSKYKNRRVEIDGIKFDSVKEGKRYSDLKLLQKEGHVQFFLRQVAFDLPGGVRYFADFLVFWVNGKTTVEDVKGVRTQIYKLKKKQVEELYPVKITEI